MKRCPKCGTTKPLDAFGKDATKPSGRSSHCRSCANQGRRNRYYGKLTHERQRSRQYYTDNREAILPQRNEQQKERYRRWLAANPDGLWLQWLKKAHGLTPEQWFAIWQEQDGLCYLGGHPLAEDRSKVVIDHDHSCCPAGRSCGRCRRGLACSNCNSAIGLLLDDPAMLRLVADNLERAKDVTAAMLMTAPVQESLFVIDGDALNESSA